MPRLGGETLKMELDQNEINRIRTIKGELGIKGTPDLMRLLLMEKYKIVTGSPNPNGKPKR